MRDQSVVYWNIQHFDLTRVTSYQITASHFHWELRARRHVLSCSTHTHVYARFFQLDSCTSNFWSELMCVSVSDRVDGYGGVYCDWCSLHESYNLFNYAQRLKVIRRKQQNVFLNRKMAESTLCVCVCLYLNSALKTVWHTSGSKSLFMRMNNNGNTSGPWRQSCVVCFSRFRKFV